jgi:hypothetical protein
VALQYREGLLADACAFSNPENCEKDTNILQILSDLPSYMHAAKILNDDEIFLPSRMHYDEVIMQTNHLINFLLLICVNVSHNSHCPLSS